VLAAWNAVLGREPKAGITGYLVKSLRRSLAHEFSLKLSQLVRRGQRAHTALGHWIGGSPPFGYRRALRGQSGPQVLAAGRRKTRGESVVLVVDPVEALIVVEIFELYVQGLGIQAIVQHLNLRGVPPPASHRREGMAAWSKSSVWAILRNPVYVGRLVFGKARYREIGKKRGKRVMPVSERVVVDDAAPAIVPPELWERAQSIHGTRAFASAVQQTACTCSRD